MAQEHQGLVFSVALSHLVDANEATKRAFTEKYKQSLFPNLGTSSGHMEDLPQHHQDNSLGSGPLPEQHSPSHGC